MVETPLAEMRSFDDQVEWLDDRHVLYGDRQNVWLLPADGTGQPVKFLSQADSPTVLSGPPVAAISDAGRNVSGGNSLALGGNDLVVNITADQKAVAVGGQFSYVVTVSNHGPGDATALRLDQMLGDDLSLAGVPASTNPGRGYGCSPQKDGRGVSCDTALVPSGATWTITVKVRADVAGTATTRVLVSAAEPDLQPPHSTSELQTTVQPVR